MTTSQPLAALGAENLFNVNGLVAVVTGGGTGIGLMITKALVANGVSKVYILGRRLQVLQGAAAQFDSDIVVPVTCDVTSKESLQSAAEQIRQEAGFVNLLVCNSGVGGPDGHRPKTETSLDEFVEGNLSVPFKEYTDTFSVNTASVWYTALSFLKLLDAGNKRGNVEQQSQIVAVTAMGGFSKIGKFAYGQSKAACNHLMKQLSVLLPQWSIRANVICPGLYPSEMSASIIEKGSIGKDIVPLERAGDEQDMAGAILYLASRAGAYCNGTIVITDGGRLTTVPSTF
ncbi:NAD(P)-binding protein [Hypoxylon sp. FL1284]|nr:NAD(P)-binding protein [Hypoxylon sp. FL1284]